MPASLGNAMARQLLRQRLSTFKTMLPAVAQLHSIVNSNSLLQDMMKRRMALILMQQNANMGGDSIAKWKFWGRSDYGMPAPIMTRIEAYQPRTYDMTKHPEHDVHKFDNPESREAGVPPQYDLRRSGLFRGCMLGESINNQLQAAVNVHIPKFYKDRGQCVLIEPKHTRDHRIPPNPGFTNDTQRRLWAFLYYILFDLFLVYAYLLLDFAWCSFDMMWSMWRIDIWVDRTGKNRRMPPWDWERARTMYTKYPQFWFNYFGSMYAGVESKKQYIYPLNEALQDKMLDAARERGTR